MAELEWLINICYRMPKGGSTKVGRVKASIRDYWPKEDHLVCLCMHNHLHKGALVPFRDGVLHGLELGDVHIDVPRALGHCLLLCVAHIC